MFKQQRLTALSMAVLLALLVAAILPISALADDTVPPQPEAPVVVDEPVTDEPIADEPTVVESVIEEPAAEEPATDEIIVPEILEQLPEDTTLVVINEEGEALPLASEEAAEVLAAPDPYFTIGSTTYQFTAVDCDPDTAGNQACANPIQMAINYLASNDLVPDNGTIYVEAGTYAENVTISGSAWTTTPSYLALVGVDGSGSTTLDGYLQLNSFTGAFYLAGFTINDYVDLRANGNVDVYDLAMNGAGDTSGKDSLYVYSGGDATLEYVDIQGNDGYGAVVDSEGNVTVSNSIFYDNQYTGLYVGYDTYVGDVVLENVESTWNKEAGVQVEANGNVVVNGGIFSNNTYGGLAVLSGGNVVLTGVTATWNGEGGEGGSGVSVDASGDMTVNGGNFSNNSGNGLSLFGSGGFTLIENMSGPDTGDIAVNGGNFSDNGRWGLEAHTFDGNITLNNVTALGNGFGGANEVKLLAVAEDTEFFPTGGAFVTSETGNIKVVCGKYSNNKGAGLQVFGNTYLGGPVLEGNDQGYNWRPAGEEETYGTLSFGECQVVVVEEEDGERGFKAQNNLFLQIPLTGQICNGEKKVVLKTGDAYGIYENLCDVDFQLKELTENDLPGELPSGVTQLGGLDAQVTSGGTAQNTLPPGGKITLKFPIPDEADEANLAVLFWNGSAWVEVPGGKVVDGFFVVTVERPGNYMLVSQ